MGHIRSVFEKLRRAGLTVKPKKCQFAMARCSYLGHVVGSGEVRPEHSKLQAVQDFPTPTIKKEVRAFLGLTGYYRKFIADYALALTDLTKKNALNRVRWTPECEQAFRTLQESLCSEPMLKSPDFDRIFILQTDAPEKGMAQF